MPLPRSSPPYEQVDPARASRQEQRRLARRVATTNYHNLPAFAPLGLCLRGGVVDAYALEKLHMVHLQLAVAGPARGDHAACCDLAALGELDPVVVVLLPQAHRLVRHSGVGAELVGLDQDAGGELEARETRGKARVVLYPRRGARLSTQGYRLQG